MSLDALLICYCGEKCLVPLTLGSGNDLVLEEPQGWRVEFHSDHEPIVTCPKSRS